MWYVNHVQECVSSDPRAVAPLQWLSDSLREKMAEPPGSSMTLDFPSNHFHWLPKGELAHTGVFVAITLCHPIAVSTAGVGLFSIYLLSKRYSLLDFVSPCLIKNAGRHEGVPLWSSRANAPRLNSNCAPPKPAHNVDSRYRCDLSIITDFDKRSQKPEGCRAASVVRQISRMHTWRVTMTAEGAVAFSQSRVSTDNNYGTDAEFTRACNV